MIDQKLKKPGKLVKFRGRRCVVQPSQDTDLIILKPLGGSDDEIMSVFEPVMQHDDEITEDIFELPSVYDLDSFLTAKLLYDAARLSFRQVSGPFRCMGKLSFRPRSYQLVPLIMSLKQSVTRLLIADDVGVGKSIEALLILRELMERGIIKSFAVLCPPHLCEQWQNELASKLDIEAEIIRSSTFAGLERKIVGDDTLSVFKYYPYQVISIDFVKGEAKLPTFLRDIPDLVIVDEAHTCTKDIDHKKSNQKQLRYELLEQIAKKENQHLVMLTATPHSGKDGEFQSLLGLLKSEFETYQLDDLATSEKRNIATHFIQRKRKNIEKWLDEETPFPTRKTEELPYTLSDDYTAFYEKVLKFARGLNTVGIADNKARMKYFAALTLLRGVMSSPAAGFEMLQKRKLKAQDSAIENDLPYTDNPTIEKWDGQGDTEQIEIIENAGLSEKEWDVLHRLSSDIEKLKNTSKDYKVNLAISQINQWIADGQSPIIFCRFIATAHYVADQLKQQLSGSKDIDIRAITSELSDDERREKIDEMGKSPKRVLVATDCLSEGINLQDKFNAILHYDLPWNPNRLEQREGRVDRYGQVGWLDKNGILNNNIEVRVLFGENNPIDVVVLKIIIEKIKNIQNTSGVSIAIAEDNRSVIDKVLKEVLLNPDRAKNQFTKQGKLDFGEPTTLSELDLELTNEIERARDKAEKIRSIFSHESIMPEDVKKDLNEVDEAIGDVSTLEKFVLQAAVLLGARMETITGGYVFNKHNMEAWLVEALGYGDKIHISFESPTPIGFKYIGRNHQFVEHLCHRIIANSLDKEKKGYKAARAAVFRTDSVTIQTTLIQFRVRNVIREVSKQHEMVSEEMFLWGYESKENGIVALDIDKCKSLLKTANALDVSDERQQIVFEKELKHFEELHPDFIKVVETRADDLVNAHTRFAKYLGAKRFEAVSPVLPPDILGVYVLIPNPNI